MYVGQQQGKSDSEIVRVRVTPVTPSMRDQKDACPVAFFDHQPAIKPHQPRRLRASGSI